jgi:hypothetical protein
MMGEISGLKRNSIEGMISRNGKKLLLLFLRIESDSQRNETIVLYIECLPVRMIGIRIQ